jgi:hypothetical protein
MVLCVMYTSIVCFLALVDFGFLVFSQKYLDLLWLLVLGATYKNLRILKRDLVLCCWANPLPVRMSFTKESAITLARVGQRGGLARRSLSIYSAVRMFISRCLWWKAPTSP